MKSEATLRLVVPASQAESVTARKVVLLVIDNRRLERVVSRISRASHVDTVEAAELSGPPNWLDQTPIDLVICDYDMLLGAGTHGQHFFQTIAKHPNQPPLILLSDSKDPERLAQMFEREDTANNIVAKLGELDNGELLVTVRKILENDIFGIEKYLRWGSVVQGHSIANSTEREKLLQRIEGFLSDLHCRQWLTGRLLTVADEFITNALYNAPVDASGNFLYANRSRLESVILPEHQAANVEFGSDGRVVALGVRDPFGSLDIQKIKVSMARCLRRGVDQIRKTTGGAGIGIYLSFQFMQHLVINVSPRRATEFVAVIDVTTSGKDLHDQPRSFNIFVERP